MKRTIIQKALLALVAGFFLLQGMLAPRARAQSDFSLDIFTQEDGLPNNLIHCVFQDSKGFIWIGTSQGLSRFDGYSFQNYLPGYDDSTSLSGNLVRVISEDSQGNLLVGTETGGLNIFDRKHEVFSQPLEKVSGFQYREVSVNDVVEDKVGNLWLATDFSLLILDKQGEVHPFSNGNSELSLEGIFIRELMFDQKGRLWIGSDEGLFYLDTAGQKLNYFDLPFGGVQNHQIWELYPGSNGEIWVGTYSKGLFIIDPDNLKFRNVILHPELPRTETVRAISKDVYGKYWIGTRGGLFLYSEESGECHLYRNNQQESRSLSNNSILSLFRDAQGETWIGTRGGLNLLAKSKQVFHNYTSLVGDNRYLNSSIVYAFWIDPQGKIWIGTEDGGINIYDPEKKKYEYLTTDPSTPHPISQNCIKAFLPDEDGNLWVGTYMGGIDVIDLETRKVKNYRFDPDEAGSLASNQVWDLCHDFRGDIWVATSRGVDRYDRLSDKFVHYTQLNGEERIAWIEPDSNGNLWMGSDNEVLVYNIRQNMVQRYFEHSRCMYEDLDQRIWIATNDRGIALYSDSEGPLKYYTEENGLSNNQALCILEDGKRNLWISTSNGLSKFDPKKEIFQNYSSKDGLGNNQFCYGAAYRTIDGNLLFGTVAGFNMFDPSEIAGIDSDVPLVFTDLKIFNRSVPIGQGKKPVLEQSISETDHLVLSYQQDVFTLEFAALNYVNSENNLYSYKLEGFNRDWIGPGKERTAPFTNLNPGDYTLRVKHVLWGSQEESRELTLAITILPPFWKTNWFLALIIFLTLVTFVVLVRFFANREKLKNQLVLERINARKLHELDMLKLKFFTNISHEIRTPLTLILGPLEKMLGDSNTSREMQENLKLMHRNAKNLNRLISQLLDFRKLQTGNLKLNLTEADIVSFLEGIVESFREYATERGIKLTFKTLKKSVFVAFDPDKIEKIINNLLSNAFKFTEPGGSVGVNLSLVFDTGVDDFSESGMDQQFIEINVKDTGKGISDSNLDKIFMRFFQSGEAQQVSGAGIGLSLVKELVHLHKGTISVSSKPNRGTKFTIRIPYNLAADDKKEASEPEAQKPVAESSLSENPESSYDARVMLIVEDNADVRTFIRSHFNSFYRIYEAVDGEEGLKLALENVPDIVISDILMPRMDGYELCKKLKNDERTSHIPVLLLTAMHSKEHELKGLSTGADDYITKPFDLSVLQAKVDNVLSMRDLLKEKYTSTMVLEPNNVVLSSPDERFLQRVIDVVEENIANAELDIEQFSVKVGVSRMQLYRKLHALTNMTVKEFIRHIRLKRATQLLEQQQLNISEIAYAVGFKDLSHFRKCFKREYGMSATDYLASRDRK